MDIREDNVEEKVVGDESKNVDESKAVSAKAAVKPSFFGGMGLSKQLTRCLSILPQTAPAQKAELPWIEKHRPRTLKGRIRG